MHTAGFTMNIFGFDNSPLWLPVIAAAWLACVFAVVPAWWSATEKDLEK